MRALSKFRLKLRSIFRRGLVEQELSDELRFHLERLIEQNLASGMKHDDARAKALRDIGNIEGLKDTCRDQRGLNFLDNLWRDSRYALRMAARNRLLSAVIVLSLSFGVAGTSAIFSLVYAVVVDPFPYTDPPGISLITFSAPGIHDSPLLFPGSDYPSIADTGSVRESFAFKRVSATATRGPIESVVQVGFSPSAFGFLGVPMLKGRAFGHLDDGSPETHVAVLSYAFWKHRYGGSEVIGQTLELDRELFTIIGVVPLRFQWASGDVYVPLTRRAGGGPEVNIVVRPRGGISLSALSLEIDGLTHRLAAASPGLYPHGSFRMRVVRMTDHVLGNTRQMVMLLSAASVLLLLIACANVSILLFARAGSRQPEMAGRVALGATTGRILGQMLIEAVMLSLAGGVLGLLLASSALRVLLLLMPANAIPRELTFQINGEVILATFATCVLTGVLFGLLPAFEASRIAVTPSMKDGGMSVAGKVSSGRSRGLLIMAEVSLTILLMAGMGVTVRALVVLHSVRLGYDPSNVIKISVPLPEGEYKTWSARAAVFDRLMSGLGSIPGVRFVAATGDAVPPNIGFPASFEMEGQSQASSQTLQIALVGGDYFAALKIPLLRGRLLTPGEMNLTRPLAVINDEMRRRYWPDGRDPIGKRIHVPALQFNNNVVMTAPGTDQWLEVIGVVGTALNEGLREPPSPAVYLPYKFALTPHCDFLMKTESDPHSLIRAIRERVHEIEPNVSSVDPRTLDEELGDFDRALPRFLAALFTLFGSVALALAATGLYSVVSYGVERRSREMAIRIALGATNADVLALVTGSTAKYAVAGLGAGLLASIVLLRLIARIVPDWKVADPIPFVMVVLVFVPIGVLACLIPAKKVTRIAPVMALRHE